MSDPALFVVTTLPHRRDLVWDDAAIRSEEVYYKADGKTVKGYLPVGYTTAHLFTRAEADQVVEEMGTRGLTLTTYPV